MNINEFLEQDAAKDILRFTTAGSVDDGKSTLIGRLLHDSKMVYEDQISAAKSVSRLEGDDGEFDYALLTDGLKAEREQGITIDVAYRYFSTPKRKFIIADTPGHEQYTRNMATGASTANLAVILIDARKGVLEQSKRHAFISSILAIPHVVVAVNKMDLVDYEESVFTRICKDFEDFAAKLDFHDVEFIPVSALKGDNVVDVSHRMPWYKGISLLNYLENVYVSSDRNLVDLRFPIQYVLRPHQDFRGFAGQIDSGVVRKGDVVTALPSRQTSRVKAISCFDGEKDYAYAPQSVTLTLEDEIDLSRGDMLCHQMNVPHQVNSFQGTVVWMDAQPLKPGRTYMIKHTTQYSSVSVDAISYGIDVNTLHRFESEELALNQIGRVAFTSRRELFLDPYAKNRLTGSFIVIDQLTSRTVGAGMVIDRFERHGDTHKKSVSSRAESVTNIDPTVRCAKYGQKPAVVWLSGFISSGKREIARELERHLFENGNVCVVMDGHSTRNGLNQGLGYDIDDTEEHHRRVGEVTKLLTSHGIIAVCAFTSPKKEHRDTVRNLVGTDRFIEVAVDAPLEWCIQRDQTGLYQQARSGEVQNVAGVQIPYELPQNPDLVLSPNKESVEKCAAKIYQLLLDRGFVFQKQQ